MLKIRSIVIILGALFLMIPSVARAQVTPAKIKLLTRNTGWALWTRLFWTTDFGQDWRDITPPLQPLGAGIADAFFLDTSHGWVLLRTPRSAAENVVFGDWGYELARTDNAGASWTVTPVQLPGLPKWQNLGMSGTVDFVDPSHGWIDLSLVSSAAFRLGLVYSTDDGGQTWHPVRNAPRIAATLRFLTPEDGWMAGGPGGGELYATHNGGKTWERIALKAPEQTGDAKYPAYTLPVFHGPRTALLPITFWAPESKSPALVVFRSGNGGRTWKAVRILPNRPEGAHYGWGAALPVGVVGAAVITGEVSSGKITLRTSTTAGGRRIGSSVAVRRGSVVSDVYFRTLERGWLLAGGNLYSTSDGGSTWANITPGHRNPVVRHETAGAGGCGGRSDCSPYESIHLGFDNCTAPSPFLVTWLVSSS